MDKTYKPAQFVLDDIEYKIKTDGRVFWKRKESGLYHESFTVSEMYARIELYNFGRWCRLYEEQIDSLQLHPAEVF